MLSDAVLVGTTYKSRSTSARTNTGTPLRAIAAVYGFTRIVSSPTLGAVTSRTMENGQRDAKLTHGTESWFAPRLPARAAILAYHQVVCEIDVLACHPTALPLRPGCEITKTFSFYFQAIQKWRQSSSESRGGIFLSPIPYKWRLE